MCKWANGYNVLMNEYANVQMPTNPQQKQLN
jgi:hypothetical protein